MSIWKSSNRSSDIDQSRDPAAHGLNFFSNWGWNVIKYMPSKSPAHTRTVIADASRGFPGPVQKLPHTLTRSNPNEHIVWTTSTLDLTAPLSAHPPAFTSVGVKLSILRVQYWTNIGSSGNGPRVDTDNSDIGTPCWGICPSGQSADDPRRPRDSVTACDRWSHWFAQIYVVYSIFNTFKKLFESLILWDFCERFRNDFEAWNSSRSGRFSTIGAELQAKSERLEKKTLVSVWFGAATCAWDSDHSAPRTAVEILQSTSLNHFNSTVGLAKSQSWGHWNLIATLGQRHCTIENTWFPFASLEPVIKNSKYREIGVSCALVEESARLTRRENCVNCRLEGSSGDQSDPVCRPFPIVKHCLTSLHEVMGVNFNVRRRKTDSRWSADQKSFDRQSWYIEGLSIDSENIRMKYKSIDCNYRQIA
jgi:hypothetical protein